MGKMKIKTCVLGMISTNCYIVYRKQDNAPAGELMPAVVIDPGDNASYIHNKCRELGVKPEAILLTHGHFDHMLAAEDVRRAFHVPIYAGEKEMALLKEPDMNLSRTGGEAVSLTADKWLREGETLELLGLKWKVLFTPGHTSGSVCYYVEEEGVLFSGDTLFCQSVGRTDLPTGSSSDIIDSVIRVLFMLPEETKVYPGHEEETTIGWEKKRNPVAYYAK